MPKQTLIFVIVKYVMLVIFAGAGVLAIHVKHPGAGAIMLAIVVVTAVVDFLWRNKSKEE
jgi:hypothetical protein